MDFRSIHVALDGTVLNDFLVDVTYDLRYMSKYNSCEDDEYAISDKVIAFEVCSLLEMMDRQTGKVLIPAMYGNVSMVSESIVLCGLERYGSDDCVLPAFTCDSYLPADIYAQYLLRRLVSESSPF